MRDKKYCRQSEKSQYMWLNMYLDIDRFLPHRSITTFSPPTRSSRRSSVHLSGVTLMDPVLSLYFLNLVAPPHLSPFTVFYNRRLWWKSKLPIRDIRRELRSLGLRYTSHLARTHRVRTWDVWACISMTERESICPGSWGNIYREGL